MAFDENLQQIVLFGGDSAVGPLTDTWILHDASWLQRPVETTLTVSTKSFMIFSSSLHSLLLFDPSISGEAIWKWDGMMWAKYYSGG